MEKLLYYIQMHKPNAKSASEIGRVNELYFLIRGLPLNQCDQIGRFFCQLGYFWKLIMIKKRFSTPQICNLWATFCLRK
jgi:hypothetical protein